MDRFNSHRDKRDKFLSMNLVVIHDITTQEAIDAMYKKLEELKKIKDSYKRGYINDRLFSFITEFKTSRKIDASINEVVLLGQTIDSFPLLPHELATLREFKVISFVIQHGEFFDFDFLHDLLYNRDYDEVIRVTQNRLLHYQMTPTKQRTVGTLEEKSMDLTKYVNENTTKPAIIYGVSAALKGLKLDRHVVIGKDLDEEQLWSEVTKLRMADKITKLHDIFELFANPATQNKIIVGKEIRQAIQDQMVQRVVVVPEIAKKIRERYSDLINFDLVEVVSDDPVVKRLQTDFGGAIGVKYY